MSKSPQSASFNPVLVFLFTTGTLILVMIVVGLALNGRPDSDDDFALLIRDADVYRGVVYDPPEQLDDFTMPSSTGEDMSLSDFRGKWVLLFFGFTHCPDICPTTLLEYAQVMKRLEDIAPQIQVVFISVDGERDTPDVLANYVSRFNPAFIGLQGDAETLARIQPQFGMWYEIFRPSEDSANYSVDHSSRTYLIDPQGMLRMSYSFGTESVVLAESIREAVHQD